MPLSLRRAKRARSSPTSRRSRRRQWPHECEHSSIAATSRSSSCDRAAADRVSAAARPAASAVPVPASAPALPPGNGAPPGTGGPPGSDGPPGFGGPPYRSPWWPSNVRPEFVPAGGTQLVIRPNGPLLDARVREIFGVLALVLVAAFVLAWLIARWIAGASGGAARRGHGGAAPLRFRRLHAERRSVRALLRRRRTDHRLQRRRRTSCGGVRCSRAR